MILEPADRIILALDVDDRDAALRLAEAAGPSLRYVKVGWQLFLGGGMPLVEEFAAQGLKIFLDLKIGDVDNTVAMAVRRLSTLPVELLTLNGNAATVAAAADGRGDRQTPGLLLVTLLSSWSAEDLGDARLDVEEYAAARTVSALDAGATGVVASGDSVGRIRERLAGRACQIITPGVRPAGGALDEHKRALTPAKAISLGADLLVVGRPIRTASDPRAAFEAIVDEVAATG